MALVEAALAGDGPLDRLVTEHLFGGRGPTLWGDWPDHAKDAWRHAVALWRLERGQTVWVPPIARDVVYPTVAESWSAFRDAVSEIVPPGLDWWVIPNVSWGDIASHLGISATATSYHLGVLGWKFQGVYRTRTVVAAPCLECGQPCPAEGIDAGRGPCCSCT